MRQRGSILVALLWVVALLAVVVTGVLHRASMDLYVVRNYGDQLQAHYLAVAAIERAKAAIYHEARERRGSRVHHSGKLYRDAEALGDHTLGRGRYRVIRPGTPEEGGEATPGITDEESRLNLNVATPEELARLEGMTADVVAALVDWRDGDNAASAGGAEIETYAMSQPPGRPRNGPLLTVREMLMVRGVSPALLLGGPLEEMAPEPLPEPGREPRFPPGPVMERGWARLFTVDSAVANVNAAGESRVDLRSADETTLTGISGITADLARAIIAHRGQRQFETIFDLLDVGPPQAQEGGPLPGGRPNATPGRPNAEAGGPKLVDQQLLIDLADAVTVGNDETLPGAINVNTAGVDVLACLPGIERETAQAIVAQRQSAGYFRNLAELLQVPGLTREVLQPLAKRLTVRSETFRLLGEGYIPSTGTRRRIQEIVRLGETDFLTLSHREDDL